MKKILDPFKNKKYHEYDHKTPYVFYKKDNYYVGKKPLHKFYLNQVGEIHRDDGPASIWNFGIYFWLNDECIFSSMTGTSASKFAGKTNHLICKLCGVFCKQQCFN